MPQQIAISKQSNHYVMTIHHEGTPFDLFHSNFMMDPYYSWNPPIRTSLTAVGINDTDDYQINLVDNDHDTQDDEPIPTGTYGGVDHTCNGMVFCSLHGDHNHHDCPTFATPTTEIRHFSENNSSSSSSSCTTNYDSSRSGIPQWSIGSA